VHQKSLTALALLATVAVLGLPGQAPASGSTSQPIVVNDVPAATTPNINNGSVQTIAQVGGRIVAGGNFTSVSPPGGQTPTIPRPNILAFDASTGNIDQGFAPSLDGTVNAVLPGPTNDTVYVAGNFRTVNGSTDRRGITLLDLADGSRAKSFTAPVLAGGDVNSLAVSGGRLFLAGSFTTVNGLPRGGLASVDAQTGTLDGYLTMAVAGHHNYPVGGGVSGPVGVTKIDASPDGRRLMAVGNFKTVNGAARDQIVMIDLLAGTAAVDPNWVTTGYTPACSYWLHDGYVRDLDFSPDGSYFVVVATGGPHAGSLCDAAARFETAATGANVGPTWVDSTGGDTLLSVAATGSAVYVGGHQRWLNDPDGANTAAPGAVPRPGVAALDPGNGLPLTWNPGRDPRGVGTWALLATAAGLWMGSDSSHLGPPGAGYTRGRIALFPLAGGSPVAPVTTAGLPGTVYLGAPADGSAGISTHTLDGSAVGATSHAPDGGIDWSTVRGAVMIAGSVYYGRSDGNFYSRTFDGNSYGPEKLLDPYHDPSWDDVQTGSGGTYAGVLPNFFAEIPHLSSLFFSSGRLYYTLAGSSPLYYRYFTPGSGTVGATEFQASGGQYWADVQGAFVAGNQLYYATRSTGALYRVEFAGGQPVPGTTTAVDTSNDWRAGATFLVVDGSRTPNLPPTAAITAHCAGRTCTASAAASSDSDGSIASANWSYGDGTTDNGFNPPPHTYATFGAHQVTLTIVDNDGAVNTARRSLPTPAVADFDGDGRSDLAVFRPSTGVWWVRGIASVHFGQNGDIPVAGDYNGDGRTDMAVFRPSTGKWYIQGLAPIWYGQNGDIPVAGDYNGDGRTDLAVFRPSNGTWYVRGIQAMPFGQNGDIPVTGDYNGDGRTDLAVFRPSTGTWYIRGVGTKPFGQYGDIPVTGDFNADGISDVTVFRPSTGMWYSGGILTLGYGGPGDVPVALDYNGDGRTEIAVWRPSTGTWWQREGATTVAWGIPGDRPIRP